MNGGINMKNVAKRTGIIVGIILVVYIIALIIGCGFCVYKHSNTTDNLINNCGVQLLDRDIKLDYTLNEPFHDGPFDFTVESKLSYNNTEFSVFSQFTPESWVKPNFYTSSNHCEALLNSLWEEEDFDTLLRRNNISELMPSNEDEFDGRNIIALSVGAVEQFDRFEFSIGEDIVFYVIVPDMSNWENTKKAAAHMYKPIETNLAAKEDFEITTSFRVYTTKEGEKPFNDMKYTMDLGSFNRNLDMENELLTEAEK